MFWIILIFLIVIAVPVAIISAKNQTVVMDVLAMHENLKRNHPDDALSQLGPHEFQRAFYVVKKKRGNKVLMRAMLWFFLSIFISAPVAGFLFSQDHNGLGALALTAILIGFTWFGAKSAHSKLPEVFDQMREELRL